MYIKDDYRVEKNDDVYDENSQGLYKDEYVQWLENKLQLQQADVISSLTIEYITKIVNAFTDINIPNEAIKEEIELNYL